MQKYKHISAIFVCLLALSLVFSTLGEAFVHFTGVELAQEDTFADTDADPADESLPQIDASPLFHGSVGSLLQFPVAPQLKPLLHATLVLPLQACFAKELTFPPSLLICVKNMLRFFTAPHAP